MDLLGTLHSFYLSFGVSDPNIIGIPRRINRICEKSLMYASKQGKRLIDEHLVRYIIEHEMLGGDV